MGINAGASAITGVYLGDQLLTKGEKLSVQTLAEMSPGDWELSAGDWNCGYLNSPDDKWMGRITGTGTSADGQFITATSLSAALGITEGTIKNDEIVWYKFVFKGEIIYIAEKVIRCISFDALANAGVVFGGKILETDQAKFRVTLLKGLHCDSRNETQGSSADSDLKGDNSEWDMLLTGLGESPYKTNFGLSINDKELGFDNMSWVKERWYGEQCVRGGYRGATIDRRPVKELSPKVGWRPALRFTL